MIYCRITHVYVLFLKIMMFYPFLGLVGKLDIGLFQITCLHKMTCLKYRKVGYKYVCDTAESFYNLDNSGGCCICALGSTQQSKNRMKCVNTSVCICHAISGGDYSCLSSSVEYAHIL